MLEKEIEKKVVAYAKSLGWEVYKFTAPGRRAVPDRKFIKPGYVANLLYPYLIYIEFKAEGKKPTPPQVREITKLRAMGFDVYVCDNVDEGKGIIDAYEAAFANGTSSLSRARYTVREGCPEVRPMG